MQYGTHSHLRTGEERADRAGAKCAGGLHMVMMQSSTFQAHHGQAFIQIMVWFDLDAVFGDTHPMPYLEIRI